MKIKTSELTGPALDWAVAKCEGEGADIIWFGTSAYCSDVYGGEGRVSFTPATDWSQGGPIIEREGMSIGMVNECWQAHLSEFHLFVEGPTPLIAAMRCYVASKLGEEIDIPKELQ